MAGKTYPLSIILRAVDEATAEIRKVNKEVAKAGASIAKVGKTLTTHVTAPIVAVGAAGVLAFNEFEQAMSNVSTLIDTTTENLDAMGRTVLEIGRRTPVAVSDLTAALYDIRSAGVGAGDQFTVLEQSARLAVAGLGSTKQAVDLVTSSMNAFNLQGEDASRIYDVVFTAVKNGKTTITDLAQGFGSVAGTVAAAGIKVDEYLASVAALTTTGLPAAQAHTQLRAAIVGLQRPTEKTRAVFRKLGAEDLNDLIKKSGGLVPALASVSKVLKGNQGRLIELFGSAEAVNAVLGLTGEQADEYTATLKDMRDGVKEVVKAFDKQNKTMRSSLQRTRNALTSAAVSIGRVLAPVLEKIAKILQRVADWFDGLDDSTKEWMVRIAAVVAAVGPAVFIFGKLISTLAALRTAFAVVSVALRGLAVLVATNPILALAAVIALAAIKIYQDWEYFEEFFELLWDGVVGAFEWAWGLIKDIVDKVVGAVDRVEKATRRVRAVAGFAVPQAGAVAGGLSGTAAKLLAEQERRGANFDVPSPAEFLGLSPQAPAEAVVRIDIANLPRGSRATVEPGSTANVDLSAGYMMAMP